MKERLKYLFLYLRELDKDQREELRIRNDVDKRIDFVLHQVEYDIRSIVIYKRSLYDWSHNFDKKMNAAGLSYSNI